MESGLTSVGYAFINCKVRKLLVALGKVRILVLLWSNDSGFLVREVLKYGCDCRWIVFYPSIENHAQGLCQVYRNNLPVLIFLWTEKICLN